jgi:DNA-binding CsgD family transcriptional regulator
MHLNMCAALWTARPSLLGKRIFEVHHSPQRDEGRVIGISGVALDITERVRVEEELRHLTSGLTPREREVLPLLARRELTARQVGECLHIAPTTVRTHIEQIAAKFGVNSTRKGVVEVALQRGLLSAVPPITHR